MTHENLMPIEFRRVKLLFPVMVTCVLLARFLPNVRSPKSSHKWWRYLCNLITEINYDVIVGDYLTQSCLQISFFSQRFHNLQQAAPFDVIDLIWRSFFLNIVNINWLCWIMRVVSTNQKRGNILNDNKKTIFNAAKGTVRKCSWAWKRSKWRGIQRRSWL